MVLTDLQTIIPFRLSYRQNYRPPDILRSPRWLETQTCRPSYLSDSHIGRMADHYISNLTIYLTVWRCLMCLEMSDMSGSVWNQMHQTISWSAGQIASTHSDLRHCQTIRHSQRVGELAFQTTQTIPEHSRQPEGKWASSLGCPEIVRQVVSKWTSSSDCSDTSRQTVNKWVNYPDYQDTFR